MKEITDAVWQELIAEAQRVMKFAYVPYSKYPVGAAALTESGAIVSGCNVENASYGLTLCAECGLVSALAMQGGGKIVAFACVDGEGNSLTPCGRCRQLLYEHGGPDLLIWDNGTIRTMAEILPGAFGPDFLK